MYHAERILYDNDGREIPAINRKPTKIVKRNPEMRELGIPALLCLIGSIILFSLLFLDIETPTYDDWTWAEVFEQYIKAYSILHDIISYHVQRSDLFPYYCRIRDMIIEYVAVADYFSLFVNAVVLLICLYLTYIGIRNLRRRLLQGY